MRIEYLGHSAFRITGSKIILIDPFLNKNPRASLKASDIKRADIVLVTHGHGDHLGDSLEICKNTGAIFVAIHELTLYAQENGVTKTEGMNMSGTIEIDGIKITAVRADHSSCINVTDKGGYSGGNPLGFVIKDGLKTVYHAGDTGLFKDMKLIGELYKPDVSLLPIGSRYTMGPREAAFAAKYVKSNIIVPMHYNTTPLIRQNPNELKMFVKELELDSEVKILEPGDYFEI
ncbi:MAG: metal-dependent hydrolase [Candidatus Methanofastidiosa archaeon]|nr:metal-dependent hydrolase [Candidatus Methanofastidiosa archaeon]